MNEKLEEQLYQRYPSLYRKKFLYGFQCGDGWYTLIDVISELLTKHDQGICAAQVKEKFGGLRFYHNGFDNSALAPGSALLPASMQAYSSGVTRAAEKLSNHICEVCGAHGYLNRNVGYWSTLCEEHRDKNSTVDHPEIDISGVADLGLGAAWSRLAVILKESADQYTEHNRCPSVTFSISKENERLVMKPSTDDELIAGMVDILEGYANRIDECSGAVIVE